MAAAAAILSTISMWRNAFEFCTIIVQSWQPWTLRERAGSWQSEACLQLLLLDLSPLALQLLAPSPQTAIIPPIFLIVKKQTYSPLQTWHKKVSTSDMVLLIRAVIKVGTNVLLQCSSCGHLLAKNKRWDSLNTFQHQNLKKGNPLSLWFCSAIQKAFVPWLMKGASYWNPSPIAVWRPAYSAFQLLFLCPPYLLMVDKLPTHLPQLSALIALPLLSKPRKYTQHVKMPLFNQESVRKKDTFIE